MDKAVFVCSACGKEFTIEYNEIADLPSVVCPKCKSDWIFIERFIYDKKPDTTPIKTGDRGCGTPGRFK